MYKAFFLEQNVCHFGFWWFSCLYLQSQLLLNGFFLKNVCDYFVMVIGTLKVLCIFIFLIIDLRQKISKISKIRMDRQMLTFTWRYNRIFGASSL